MGWLDSKGLGPYAGGNGWCVQGVMQEELLRQYYLHLEDSTTIRGPGTIDLITRGFSVTNQEVLKKLPPSRASRRSHTDGAWTGCCKL